MLPALPEHPRWPLCGIERHTAPTTTRRHLHRICRTNDGCHPWSHPPPTPTRDDVHVPAVPRQVLAPTLKARPEVAIEPLPNLQGVCTGRQAGMTPADWRAEPSADQCRPAQTSTDQYRPVQTSTDQYRPVQTSTDQRRPEGQTGPAEQWGARAGCKSLDPTQLIPLLNDQTELKGQHGSRQQWPFCEAVASAVLAGRCWV